MGELKLSKVLAYYLDPATGELKQLLPENALLAEDVAGKWAHWRQLARDQMGWELLVEPGDHGAYTRAMFRTPQDQEDLYRMDPGAAAKADSSPHQAGRAVDLDLSGMAATYSNYSYSKLVDLAKQAGLSNRVYKLNGSEPWHFDDDPASLFGSTYAAISAIGNLGAQVLRDVQAGLATPQMQALGRTATSAAPWILLGLGVVLAIRASSPAPRRRHA